MKKLLIAMALFSGAAFAQSSGKMNNVLIDVGFPTGGFKFGGAYEYIYNGSQGIGGQFHYYPKNNDKGQPGAMVLGAMTGFHFYKGDWDFSLSPSLNIINIDDTNDKPGDKTTLGPGLAIALTTSLNEKVAIGFAYHNFYTWFGDDYRGKVIDDLNFRVKIGF